MPPVCSPDPRVPADTGTTGTLGSYEGTASAVLVGGGYPRRRTGYLQNDMLPRQYPLKGGSLRVVDLIFETFKRRLGNFPPCSSLFSYTIALHFASPYTSQTWPRGTTNRRSPAKRQIPAAVRWHAVNVMPPCPQGPYPFAVRRLRFSTQQIAQQLGRHPKADSVVLKC